MPGSEIIIEEISDDEAILLAGQGNTEAFSVLYLRYVKRIYNYIYYRTGSQHDAEDLTERVFFRAMNHIKNYHNRGLPFSAWLYRIAHNLVANWHRDSRRKREVPLDDHSYTIRHGEQPESALVRNQEIEGLMEAIRKLPEDRQNLLILKFVEHMSNEEIAHIMGRSEGAIKSLYHRTLLSLRDDLGILRGE